MDAEHGNRAMWGLIMLHLLRTILVAATLSLCAVEAQAVSQTDEESALADAERSVVRVSIIERTDDGLRLRSYGSGFVVAPGVVATNFHVIADTLDDAKAMRSNMRILVTPTPAAGGTAVPAEPRWFVASADLALIMAPGLSAPALPIAQNLPGKTDRVRALGYPGKADDMLSLTADEIIQPRAPYATTGQIALLSDRAVGGLAIATIFHTASISRGNSGGPLVDACGRLIGVNTWAGGAQVDADGYVAAAGSQFVATRQENLTRLLSDAAVAATVDDTPCALGGVGANPEMNQKLATLNDQLAQAQRDAAEARRANEAALVEARKARESTFRMVLGAVLVAAAALALVWLRGRRAGRAASIVIPPATGAAAAPSPALEPMSEPEPKLEPEPPPTSEPKPPRSPSRPPLRFSRAALVLATLAIAAAILVGVSTLTWS